jgi:glucose-1-phosphate cytidylyltransferase
MKAIILAGGLGTRISEESLIKPKPMIEIGGKPILWHVMKIYSFYGVNEFIICLGYKGYLIKEYFANYFLHNADVTFNIANNQMQVHHHSADNWRVTLIDTGEKTMTGGRLKRIQPYLENEDFYFTYGDGVSDVNLHQLRQFHQQQKTLATVTAVQPPGRFGSLDMQDNKITSFKEKPQGDGTWINGGFFILSPKVIEYIDNDETIWERAPLEKLAQEGQLSAFVHRGFWQPMDTLRDKTYLEELWNTGQAPWRVWQ